MRININKRTLRKVTAKHMSINVPAQKIEDNIEPLTEKPKSEITEAEPEVIETTTLEETSTTEIEEIPVVAEEEEVKPEPKKNSKKSKKSTTDSKEENNKE